MGKTSNEILEDIRAYFESKEINAGRWRVEEVNMIIDKTRNDAIVVTAILVPRINCQSLTDLI